MSLPVTFRDYNAFRIGYAGDVWDQQPSPQNHEWRYMRNPLGGGNGMVPHYSGTTLDAQARYAAGVKSILHNFFENKEQDPANLIVSGGGYATKACRYSPSILTTTSQWFNFRRSTLKTINCTMYVYMKHLS